MAGGLAESVLLQVTVTDIIKIAARVIMEAVASMVKKTYAGVTATTVTAQPVCNLSMVTMVMLIEDPDLVLHMVAEVRIILVADQDHRSEARVTSVATAPLISMNLLGSQDMIAAGTMSKQSCITVLHLAGSAAHDVSLY